MFLEDILASLEKIERYLGGMNQEKFASDDKTVDAVARNLEVIGEAAKNLPAALRERHPDVPWRRLIGLRNVVVHEYFGMDLGIIWRIVRDELPTVKASVKKVLEAETA
jgi:uncharacterized protein with HEPN domain